MSKFASDVEVMLDMKSEDKSRPGIFKEKGPKFSYLNLWTNDMWEEYIDRKRYLRYAKILLTGKSRLFRLILPQLLVLSSWSTIVGLQNYFPFISAFWARYSWLKISMPMSALSILSSFVAALLTLRTNQCLSRVAEGRLAWGRNLLLTRDLGQLLFTNIYSVNKKMGLLAARNLSLFGFLVKNRMRDEDNEDIVKQMLPSSDSSFVLSQRKQPIALIARIRHIISSMQMNGEISDIVGMKFDNLLLELNRIYGMCERIRGSPIPVLYTSHASRLLQFYLFFLPIALNAQGAPALLNIIATSFTGYVMLGLDEISHQIEQPFRIIPMHQVACGVARDVADAFVCQPPKLPGYDYEPEEIEYPPSYW